MIISIFVGLFLLTIILLQQRSAKKTKSKKYSIGVITKKEVQKNGSLYYYQYVIKSTTYQGSFRSHQKNISAEERIFISFDSLEPKQSFSALELGTPTADLIAPDEGWEKIPEGYQ